jgi:ribosome maturation factor RimP
MDKFTKKEVESLIARAAVESSVEIYESSIQLRKGRAVIAVSIDTGTVVSHDDCVRYTRALDSLIEQAGIEDDYILEVASPGLKRKLRTSAEFIRFTGSPVKIVFGGARTGFIKGSIVSADVDAVTVDDGKNADRILFSDIKNANLDY